jgi:hypothetical protein
MAEDNGTGSTGVVAVLVIFVIVIIVALFLFGGRLLRSIPSEVNIKVERPASATPAPAQPSGK